MYINFNPIKYDKLNSILINKMSVLQGHIFRVVLATGNININKNNNKIKLHFKQCTVIQLLYWNSSTKCVFSLYKVIQYVLPETVILEKNLKLLQ